MVTFSYLCRIKKNNFMVVDFDDENLEELIKTGGNSKYKKLSKDKNFIIALVSVYNVLLSVEKTDELKNFSYLHYEKLTANRSGQSSVRIKNGRVERLIFKEFDGGIKIVLLELNELHYGNKK